MALYCSQFRKFFSDRDDCVATLLGYGHSIGPRTERIKRYWQISAA